jgi:hypothetical protein
MSTENLIEILSSEALAYPAKAKEIRIYDQTSLDTANAFLRGIKGLLSKIAETFDPIIKRNHEAHKKAIEERNKHQDPLLQAEWIIKTEMGRYLTEQARIQREAEEKAKHEAAEAERKRLETMQAAIEAENAGKTKEAERIFEQALAVEAIKTIAPLTIKAQGTFVRKEFKWRLVDKSKIPLDFLELDEVAINKRVRALGFEADIPGIEVYEDTTVVARI